MCRSAVVLLLASAGAAAVLGAAGCRHGAKDPAGAYRELAAAVKSGDGGALFDALDQKSRWAFTSVQKWHREAYDIVLSAYPEGPVREREKHRFEHAATATSARELFKTDVAPELLPKLASLAAAAGDPAVEMGPSESEATVVLASGARVPFARGSRGGWGYAGLDEQAQDQKLRAYHDLEVVRSSAADYERAAARNAP
jgi:hypothetical protein